MGNKILNKRAQANLELALMLVIMVSFLGGVLNIWLWANKQLVKRQVEYNKTRVTAGTSADIYSLQWPVYRPEELVENKVLLDTPGLTGRK